METLDYIFRKENNLDALQMSIRGAIVFLTALILLRIGSTRAYGKGSAIDIVVMITLGGILGRVITGAAPFLPAIATVFTIIVLHHLLARLCTYSHRLGNLIKGKKRILYVNDKMVKQNMRKESVTRQDLEEGVRLALNEADFKNVAEIRIERNGRISVVKKMPLTAADQSGYSSEPVTQIKD